MTTDTLIKLGYGTFAADEVRGAWLFFKEAAHGGSDPGSSSLASSKSSARSRRLSIRGLAGLRVLKRLVAAIQQSQGLTGRNL
jgi:hypothetical protein